MELKNAILKRAGAEKHAKIIFETAVKDLCPRYSVLTPIVGTIPPPVRLADHYCKALYPYSTGSSQCEGVIVTPCMSEERLWEGMVVAARKLFVTLSKLQKDARLTISVARMSC